jgi:hypothetical protein
MNSYDLIILIFACYTKDKYKEEINNINNTWGKKSQEYSNIKMLYFVGEEHNTDFYNYNNIEYINLPGVKDDYLSASYKQFLGMKYISENYNTKFIFCCGTDTYINIPKLLLFINNFDYEECLYIGSHGCNRQIGNQNYYFHSGGPGFIITQNTLKKIYHLLEFIMNDWTNRCNIYNVQYLIVACDVAISYYLQQPGYDIKIIKTNDLSLINCNYLGYPCHCNEIDINNIISCHYMKTHDFYDFTNILNENNYFV